ncbi:MAG: LCCL domain-containing protein [Pyrinomonadaceae bacterium]
MKICPQCDRTYHDDELNFCLMCGMSLVDGASQPTVAISGGGEATVVMDARATMAEPKRHGLWFWIGVTVASIVGVTGATFAIFFLYFFITADPTPSNNRNANVAAIKKPRVKSPPAPTATPSPEESPEPSPADEDAVQAISWVANALEFKAKEDETRTFMCPPNGSESAIFGTDTYAANSSICTAAVHAGMIDFEEGGEVTIKFRPGLPNYLVTRRHGIMSNMFGNEELSFVFVHYDD